MNREAYHKTILDVIGNLISSDLLEPKIFSLAIQYALEKMGLLTEADHVYLFLFNEDKTEISCTHEWHNKKVVGGLEDLQHLNPRSFTWVNKSLTKRNYAVVKSLSALPGWASTEKKIFAFRDIKSILFVSMELGEYDLGCLVLDTVREKKNWPPD
jgi:hypothetical protein